MDYLTSFQISASGMAVEKLRLTLTALNLANMQSTAARPDQVYRPQRLVTEAVAGSFGQAFDASALQAAGVRVSAVVPEQRAPKLVYEPGHPYADARGMVAYPAVDQTAEMLQLASALRAYEANVVALNAAKTMAARTLEIGGQP